MVRRYFFPSRKYFQFAYQQFLVDDDSEYFIEFDAEITQPHKKNCLDQKIATESIFVLHLSGIHSQFLGNVN